MFLKRTAKAPLQGFWAGISRLADCLGCYPIRYWIQDSTHLAQVPLEDQQQALRLMVPVVLDSQLKKMAWVVALDHGYRNVFNQLVEEEQTKAAEQLLFAGRTIEVQQFKTYKEAADWIADIKA